MSVARCPRCGSTATRLISLGHFECQGSVTVAAGGPPSGALGLPTASVPCGYRFSTGPAAGQSLLCACSTFAVGLCATCSRPVCGGCSLAGTPRRCHECRRHEAAQQKIDAEDRARQEVTAEAAVRSAFVDALQAWVANPPDAVLLWEHRRGANRKRDLPAACPIHAGGRRRGRVRRDRPGHLTTTYECPGWPLDVVIGPTLRAPSTVWLLDGGRFLGDVELEQLRRCPLPRDLAKAIAAVNTLPRAPRPTPVNGFSPLRAAMEAEQHDLTAYLEAATAAVRRRLDVLA